MRVPERLISLVEDGIVDEVVRPLMSGKEAQVYLVIAGGEERVAKVYKESSQRLFRHRSEYTEGRRTRNSRDQRAMGRGSKHGRSRDEQSWQTAEVDMIYRLQEAGVRVPVPFSFMDGVLVMELVADADGSPAPQIGNARLGQREAIAVYDGLLQEVVRMLCAGVVHGDLSEFNVLMAAEGPVVIDFPQAVDATSNPGARKLLLRDVANLHRFVERFVPGMRRLPYGEEMWELYERGDLTRDTKLQGKWSAPKGIANVDAVLDEIDAAEREAWEKRAKIDGDDRDRDDRGPSRSASSGHRAPGRGGQGGGGSGTGSGSGGGRRSGGGRGRKPGAGAGAGGGGKPGTGRKPGAGGGGKSGAGAGAGREPGAGPGGKPGAGGRSGAGGHSGAGGGSGAAGRTGGGGPPGSGGRRRRRRRRR